MASKAPGNDDKLKWKAQEAERLILQVLVQWYCWLSNRAVSVDQWREVPYWCKRVPHRIDSHWVMGDHKRFIENKISLNALFEVIDHANMSIKEVDLHLPDLELLRTVLEELLDE